MECPRGAHGVMKTSGLQSTIETHLTRSGRRWSEDKIEAKDTDCHLANLRTGISAEDLKYKGMEKWANKAG